MPHSTTLQSIDTPQYSSMDYDSAFEDVSAMRASAACTSFHVQHSRIKSDCNANYYSIFALLIVCHPGRVPACFHILKQSLHQLNAIQVNLVYCGDPGMRSK